MLINYLPMETAAISAWADAIAESPDPVQLLRRMVVGHTAEALFSSPRWDAREVPTRLLAVTRAILERRVHPESVGLMRLFLQPSDRWRDVEIERAHERLRDVFAVGLSEIASDVARKDEERRRAAAAWMLSYGVCTENGLVALKLMESLGHDPRGRELVRLAHKRFAEDSDDVGRSADDRLFVALKAWCGGSARAPSSSVRRPILPRGQRPRKAVRKRARRG